MAIGSNPHTIVENSAYKLGFDDCGERVAVNSITPLDELIDSEETDDVALVVNRAQLEAVRRLLIFVFADSKNPLEALQKLHLITYQIAPNLFEKDSLAEVSRWYDSSKQAFSYKLLKLNDKTNLRGRNQKSDTARASYSESTKLWHKERKEQQLEKETISTMSKEISSETRARLAAAGRKRWENAKLAKAAPEPELAEAKAKPARAKSPTIEAAPAEVVVKRKRNKKPVKLTMKQKLGNMFGRWSDKLK